jgi:hypothetical protein
MQRLKVLGLALVAVFALGAVVAATAGALPLVLPETTGKKSSDSSIGATIYKTVGGKEVKCEKATGTTEEEAPKPLGPFHITFKECTATEGGLTVKCTGLGDATTGEILTLGTYHLVYDKSSTELPVEILFLVGATHFTCGGIFLIKVEGSESCLIKEPYVAKTLHEFTCTQVKGVSGDPTYFNDEGKEVKSGLTSSTSEAAAEGAAEEAKGLILWLEKESKNVEVTIMMS